MTLEYIDIAQLGFETKKKIENNYDRVPNHCAPPPHAMLVIAFKWFVYKSLIFNESVLSLYYSD
jgi:hypothetical protein